MRPFQTAALVALMLCSISAEGEVSIGNEPVAAFANLGREIVFEPIPSAPPDVGLELINGRPVRPEHFPTVFRMTTGGTCTAALVGEAALLTAAHCVDHKALIRFVLGGRSIQGYCEHAPGYVSSKGSEDWAMCLLEFPVLGIRYETLDIGQIPAVDTDVRLTGYGCTFKNGPLDGVLRIGDSKIVAKPNHPGFPSESSTLYTRSDVGQGEAVLCPGDSGGPLFLYHGNDDNSARNVVGVNSRTTYEYGVSLFAAVASEAGKRFFEDWSSRYAQKVCGVTLKNDLESCR